MIEENVNHDTCHVAISRGPCSPQQAHPLVCYSLLPLPAPAAISSQRADPGNCFSLCKMKKRWKRTSGVRTNAQSLGLPKVHRLPTLRCFLPQRQSRSVCPPSWPCWRLPILKCSISHLWFLPLLSMRQNCWQAEREGNVWGFYKLIWAMRTHFQPCLESGPEASGASCFPTLTCLPESPIFERCALSPAL